MEQMTEREPHAVPRGLLRFYMLKLLTEGPMKGYELITKIESRTEGVWKPGPGSIYPMVASLREEGLIQSSSSKKKGTAQKRGTKLQITEKGREALKRFRENMRLRMNEQNRNLFSVFAEIAFPGMGLEEVVLAQRKMEIDRLKRGIIDDDYWKTLPPERKRKFLEALAQTVQEELDFIKKSEAAVN
jgi:DNA-binding PadR family transcriptional regulator